MRGVLSVSVVKLALGMAVLLAGFATDAFAAGSISGRVTSSTTTLGLQGTVVQFYDLNGEADGPTATATTDASGDYTVNLPPGSYGVLTQDIHGYINEIWNNIPCSSTCNTDALTAIVVANDPITNIDFVLDPGGRVAGTITDSGTGLPIANVVVGFIPSVGDEFPFTTAVTDGAGHYISDGGIATGNVFAVTHNSQGYRNEVYNNVYCLGCDPTMSGTAIAVVAGVTTPDINFVLDPGGRISGNVMDASSNPLSGVQVEILDSNGSFVDEVPTDVSGNYGSGGLPSGTYYARTDNALGLADKLYNDLLCPGGTCNSTIGTPISVASPSTTAGVNFVLPPGGRIAGTVTNASGGAPIQGVFVGIFDMFGAFIGGDNTNASGQYTTGVVPAGTYYAAVVNFPGFLHQLYDHLPCTPTFCPPTSGTPITVVVGATTGSIDFALTPVASSGSISGTVISTASGLPINNWSVQVLLSTGQNVGSVPTDGSGVYTMAGLGPGSYYVRTTSNGSFVNEVYNDVTCVSCSVTTSGGTLVVVVAGATTSNIDFSLATGGRISGTITNAVGGAPLQGVAAQVFNTSGVGMGQGNSNASGVYNSPGLPAGTYYVRTSNSLGFVNELYDNQLCPGSGCNVLAGTPIVVTAGVTTAGKDFALTSGGRISGVVTSAVTTAPIPFVVTVQIFDAVGANLGFVGTDASGVYITSGLPAGTYYVRTSNFVGFVDELYDNIPCPTALSCTITSGTPISVTVGVTTGGVNFALSVGGSVTGTVTDAVTALGLGSVLVLAYTPAGVFARAGATASNGAYTVSGLPAGTYYVRTSVPGGLFYFDELWNEMPCNPACDVTTGTPIVVAAGANESAKNFTLSPGGGSLGGTVTDAVTAVGLIGVLVQVYTSTGSLVKAAGTNATGAFAVGGLPAGTYYARTSVPDSQNYVNELFNNLPCLSDCVVTDGAPIVVAAGATTPGVNFSLAPNLVRNGHFDVGTANWLQFATPDISYIVSSVVDGVFEFTRVAPPPGQTNHAEVFQETGTAHAAGVPLVAQFDLGNSSTVRKRVKVLVLDSDFSDLAGCTFWLPPGSPLRSYQMHTHTNKAWTNAAIYFYAATPGANGGAYQLDNVLLYAEPSGSSARIDCVDPLAPAPLPGDPSGTLVTNGDFGTGLAPWVTFGTLTWQISAGVFEFIRPSSTPPAGVVLQPTNQTATAGELLTATFELGNSSGVPKRVKVLMHDNNFSDLSGCSFYLDPGQALLPYAMGMYATKAWANATISFYGATVGADQWTRLDNVTLKRTPSSTIVGTECVEPGGGSAIRSETATRTAAVSPGSTPFAAGFAALSTAVVSGGAQANDAAAGMASTARDGSGAAPYPLWEAVAIATARSIWQLDGPVDLRTATDAHITLQSWLSSEASTGSVQVSMDAGANWLTVGEVPPSTAWASIDFDLSAYVGGLLDVRMVFDGVEPADPTGPDVWRVADVEIAVYP